MLVTWIRCGPNKVYCPFESVNLENVSAYGVYVIWYNGRNGEPGRVVRLGQGDIKSRLIAHRSDKDVLAYKAKGLYVTWAAVPKNQVNSVERYLANQWPPLVGDAFPKALPLAVNSPFG